MEQVSMLFSSQSSEKFNLSATSLNSSALQSNPTALSLSTVSAGLADPIQQSNLRLRSSASGITAATELTPLSASSSISKSALVNIANEFSFSDLDVPNKFKTGIDVLEDTSYNKLGHLLNPALDDTLAGAFDMGRLDGKTRTRLDSIGNGDNIDYTHFRLDQASAFNLFLKGASGNAAVDLLAANGTTIASSYDGQLRLAQGISTTQNFDTHDIALNSWRFDCGESRCSVFLAGYS
jgi:hypothetical protein